MFDCQWSPVDGVKAAGSATRPCIPAAGFGRHAKGMVSDFKGGASGQPAWSGLAGAGGLCDAFANPKRWKPTNT